IYAASLGFAWKTTCTSQKTGRNSSRRKVRAWKSLSGNSGFCIGCELRYYASPEFTMKHLIGILMLIPLALAQNSAPPSNRVEWKSSSRGAAKDLPDGRTQKTVASSSATVSAIADVTNSRRFIDPPMEGGNQVAYVAIG